MLIRLLLKTTRCTTLASRSTHHSPGPRPLATIPSLAMQSRCPSTAGARQGHTLLRTPPPLPLARAAVPTRPPPLFAHLTPRAPPPSGHLTPLHLPTSPIPTPPHAHMLRISCSVAAPASSLSSHHTTLAPPTALPHPAPAAHLNGSTAAPQRAHPPQQPPPAPLHPAAVLQTELGRMQLESSRASQAAGRIEVIVGPMFAGKSTLLLQRARAAAAEGQRVAYVKSSRDVRYAKGRIVTHNGEGEDCYAVQQLGDLEEAAGELWEGYEVIAIDEAQFFPDLLPFCIAAADTHSKTLHVAGLDGDFKRGRFGAILDLVPLADTVQKLSSTCSECGAAAPFTLRTISSQQQEVVGGIESYRPMCRRHYGLHIRKQQQQHQHHHHHHPHHQQQQQVVVMVVDGAEVEEEVVPGAAAARPGLLPLGAGC